MPIIAVNGIEIYYEVHGSGPPLLAISGTGGDLRRMPPARMPVTQHFETLAYDQRGLGQTSKPEGPYTMADYADDAAALVRALGWDRCHVMGTSFGGMVALNLAVRHPELIDRLVLNCTSAGGISASYPLHTLGSAVPSRPDDADADAVFATRMTLSDTRWDPNAEQPIPGLGSYYATMANAARTPVAPEMAAGLAQQLQARAGHDVVAQLADISAETLICAGRYDGIAPVENSELLHDQISDSRLEIFDGGHLFLMQDPQAWSTIIGFLRGGV